MFKEYVDHVMNYDTECGYCWHANPHVTSGQSPMISGSSRIQWWEKQIEKPLFMSLYIIQSLSKYVCK